VERPALVTTVTIAQSLLGLLLTGTAVYVLWLTRSREILNGPDAADAVHGLKIGAAVLGAPALILLIATVGLCRSKLWGWWLALATDVVMLAAFAYSTLDENTIDAGEVAMTVGFAIFSILLLLPKVRKFYWTGSNGHPLGAEVGTEIRKL
jgi:hypothetical protein